MVRTIAELPFHERPVRELLDLTTERATPNADYAGYGWARVDQVWLVAGTTERAIDDALVLGLHSADDGELLGEDIELEFELPDRPVSVLASMFLDRWLPRLPRASAIVLALCNPHRARLRSPAGLVTPVHYADGDVTAWLDRDHGDRLELVADTWGTLAPP